jgi:hypothetical protein
MDIIYYTIIFCIVFCICIYIWVLDLLLTRPVYYYVYGDKESYFKKYVYGPFMFVVNNFPNCTAIFFVLAIIFFLIMYLIYLFITIVIPETGILTIFIPVRELLLQIYPLPDLQKFGVFRFIEAIIRLFTSNENFNDRMRHFFYEYFLFSKNGTIELIKIFNPSIDESQLDNAIVEAMKNYNKDEKYKKIAKDVNVCVSNNSDLTPPDATFIDGIKSEVNNIKTNIDCNLKSVGSYISTDI